MTPDKAEGFVEIEHTADISLKIWAKTLNNLFKLAVDGMNSIIEIDLDDNDTGKYQKFSIQDMDLESMLVSLLNECNYIIQQDLICTKIMNIFVENEKITGNLFLQGIRTFRKEIKAVTYHNLKINSSTKGYSVVIVFDV
ncbi:MAG: archease [Anaerolineaceae bacterium]|nr:archease [Anaerolineaceae bacterium]